ncbi:hypothetical protein ACFP81_13945 [Deinococcus lacus]|uniref:Anthranilate synthase component I N-terminal domain-containing protein n=1 Tax=Deinococcus lacus TaxID=392561 RepID=A0ABW1YF86_9DEIO
MRSGRKLSSLMLLEPALRLTCQGHAVTAQALTEAGAAALAHLCTELGTQPDAPAQATFAFPAPPVGLSEEERLRFPNNLEPLRLLQQLLGKSSGPDAPLLMGAFGFDLLASFEDLPPVVAGPNTCPDYRFYLAQTALRLDHQIGTATLFALTCSGGSKGSSVP